MLRFFLIILTCALLLILAPINHVTSSSSPSSPDYPALTKERSAPPYEIILESKVKVVGLEAIEYTNNVFNQGKEIAQVTWHSALLNAENFTAGAQTWSYASLVVSVNRGSPTVFDAPMLWPTKVPAVTILRGGKTYTLDTAPAYAPRIGVVTHIVEHHFRVATRFIWGFLGKEQGSLHIGTKTSSSSEGEYAIEYFVENRTPRKLTLQWPAAITSEEGKWWSVDIDAHATETISVSTISGDDELLQYVDIAVFSIGDKPEITELGVNKVRRNEQWAQRNRTEWLAENAKAGNVVFLAPAYFPASWFPPDTTLE